MKEKILSFLKTYGFHIVYICIIIGCLSFSVKNYFSNKSLWSNYQELSSSSRATLSEVQRRYNEEIRQHQELDNIYKDTLRRVEERHRIAIEELNRQKQQELERIIQETRGNPERMAQRINQLFGIPIQ